jgi:hypothetical protein
MRQLRCSPRSPLETSLSVLRYQTPVRPKKRGVRGPGGSSDPCGRRGSDWCGERSKFRPDRAHRPQTAGSRRPFFVGSDFVIDVAKRLALLICYRAIVVDNHPVRATKVVRCLDRMNGSARSRAPIPSRSLTYLGGFPGLRAMTSRKNLNLTVSPATGKAIGRVAVQVISTVTTSLLPSTASAASIRSSPVSS